MRKKLSGKIAKSRYKRLVFGRRGIFRNKAYVSNNVGHAHAAGGGGAGEEHLKPFRSELGRNQTEGKRPLVKIPV